ncbi:MAG TPA: flagellar hook-associated protein FlgK [Thermoclostridium caenicola]|nr:flagellar hook-associated protein FlgK [Thermoclostridium caenicola]
MIPGLNYAVSGLSANQRALEVTGHNVSNLGTAGFARQGVIMATALPHVYGNWKVEMGVSIQQIRQIRHLFLDNIYRVETNAQGYWEARSTALNDLQAILAEPMAEGLQSALNRFWDGWQELSKAPESLTIRALLKQRADALVDCINHIGAQLNKLQKDLNNEIKLRIDEVNEITQKIADLNIKIMSAEAAGNTPNDYYDERNALVDRLSTLVKAETYLGPEGNMDIMVGGYYLVSKGKQTRIYAQPSDDLSQFYTPMVEGFDVEIHLGQGLIQGLLEARGQVSGAKGSYDNGTPNTTADVTIVVDIANNTTDDYRTKLQNNIRELAEDLRKRGLDYNLRLMVIGVDGATEFESVNFGRDVDALINKITSSVPVTVEYTYDFGDVIDKAGEAISTLNPEVNRYLLMFTGDSLNGDGSAASSDDIKTYQEKLNAHGFTLSVATKTDNYSGSDDTGESGWDALTGRLYDITSTGYVDLMRAIGKGINDDVNMKISTIPEDLNIISSVKKQLNALINIMAREINYIHQSGKTLNGADGGLFFEPVNDELPIEMGNLMVAGSLKDFNNIVASAIDANGDNTLALRIAGLRNANLMTGNGKVLSLDTYYQNIIMDVGNKGQGAANMLESQKKLVQQADQLRQSIMGVSLDEEMTNMIKFKYAYNANSKIINVIDSMLETLIYRLGLAGR